MTTAVREKPILFNGEMVRAILGGRKWMTRRVVNCFCNGSHLGKKLGEWGLSKPPYQWARHGEEPWRWCGNKPPSDGDWVEEWQTDIDDYATGPVTCPYGEVGTRLWVREAFGRFWGGWKYRATDDRPELADENWKPSIHMPREASRINLEVTDIRVERLNEISEEDAQAEGVDWPAPYSGVGGRTHPTCIDAFRELWDSINSKRTGYAWDDNPYVWAVSFKVVE